MEIDVVLVYRPLPMTRANAYCCDWGFLAKLLFVVEFLRYRKLSLSN